MTIDASCWPVIIGMLIGFTCGTVLYRVVLCPKQKGNDDA
jgi:hypothetical protein